MRKTDQEIQNNGQAASAAETRSAAQQPQLPFFDAVMPPTMTTENTSPNDAHAAPGAVDPHSANGTGAELIPAEAGTQLPASATPEAAHEAALAADAIARAGADDAPHDAAVDAAPEMDPIAQSDAPPRAMPEAAHDAALAADAVLHADEETERSQAIDVDADAEAPIDAARESAAAIASEFESPADVSAQAASDAHVEATNLAVSENVLVANAV